jgi:aspartyl aminopeptidase
MTSIDDLLAFLAASPTAAHAVAESARRLTEAGFKQLDERDAWKLKAGDAFFVVRGGSSLVAGVVGKKAPAKNGFRLVGAHTDVPGLRLKPRDRYAHEGYLQLGVEVYGGPILATWLDRDLTLAGRLIVREKGGGLAETLVRLATPICRIPSLAIHLNRQVNDDGLKLDKQKHLPPICGLGDQERLEVGVLRQALAEAAGVEADDLVEYRLDLVDVQPPALGGLENEFVFARGIDNLVSCFAALEALTALPRPRETTAVIALFDSEEVGSDTARGASSTFLDVVLERLCQAGKNPREELTRALAQSLLASADGAHAVHPNYADQHDPRHKPRLNSGPVIKVNAGERYATTVATQAYLQECAELAGLPVQHFVQRSDLPCGTTIGPLSATRLGVATVDVGAPMLSMHSIRETTGAADARLLAELLAAHLGGEVGLVR